MQGCDVSRRIVALDRERKKSSGESGSEVGDEAGEVISSEGEEEGRYVGEETADDGGKRGEKADKEDVD